MATGTEPEESPFNVAVSAPAAARQGTDTLAGPLALDNLLSLNFLAPTVRDAKRQVSGLVSGLSPAPANASGLGRLLK
ncbi:hypothetical protein AB0I68_31250 [Streptomyces sp. NPDC050448]|uniref:hypothetical protein n=1 Tax=Streptomyces sp. NPDC050448 TaxID=3155404 RepID=UPI0034488412